MFSRIGAVRYYICIYTRNVTSLLMRMGESYRQNWADIKKGDACANGRISPQGQSGASRSFQVPRAKKARIQITINR